MVYSPKGQRSKASGIADVSCQCRGGRFLRDWWPQDWVWRLRSLVTGRWYTSYGICSLVEIHQPVSYTAGRECTIKPPRREGLLDAFCQHLLYSWHKPRTGGEFIHGSCFALSCIWKLTLVSSEFQSRQKHNNWAVSQPQGEGIWEWQKNRIPFLLLASGFVLYPVVVKGVYDGQWVISIQFKATSIYWEFTICLVRGTGVMGDRAKWNFPFPPGANSFRLETKTMHRYQTVGKKTQCAFH